MAARVIHFGTDDCHRLTVLRTAGYVVDACTSLVQLHKALKTTVDPDAVCIAEGDGAVPEAAGNLARSHSRAPVILFQSTNLRSEDTVFDLVVPTLTPPQTWLREMEALIAESQAIRVRSRSLIENSRELREEAAVARKKSKSERARSRSQYQRSTGTLQDGSPRSAPQSES